MRKEKWAFRMGRSNKRWFPILGTRGPSPWLAEKSNTGVLDWKWMGLPFLRVHQFESFRRGELVT